MRRDVNLTVKHVKKQKMETEVLIAISRSWQNIKRKTPRRSLEHRVGRARTSDLLENNFIIVVSEKIFFILCFGQKILIEL